MRFSVTQLFGAPAEAVIAAYRTEEVWRSFTGLPFVGDPVVDHFDHGEPVQIHTSYLVDIDLPGLATQFIDADKMTFVEQTQLQSDGSGTFRIVPDHYAKLLHSQGSSRVVPVDGDRCERLIEGVVDVKLGWTGKLFEGPVEQAIVGGLSKALTAQADQLILR